MGDKSFKFEIINELGVISSSTKGWKKELNRISWYGGEPKYDIRDWAADHEIMGKGVTLTEQELYKLKELLVAEIDYLQRK
jgi:hypothetical protein